MLSLFLMSLAAFLAAGLTLFSGFGLGTLLLPVLALFFPVEIAIALTAVVHLLNNLLKLLLLGRYAERTVVLQFGVPALPTAFLGAWVLGWLANLAPLMSYQILGRDMHVMPVKAVIAMLLVVFAIWELIPTAGTVSFEKNYLFLGGLLSGFFGGLSGHQGALRSAFLLKSGLSKDGFLGTGAVIACLVDIARITVYGAAFPLTTATADPFLLPAVIGSALLGTWLANRYVKKLTMSAIQALVFIMLLGIAIGLAIGVI